jgi:hypothetical protein
LCRFCHWTRSLSSPVQPRSARWRVRRAVRGSREPAWSARLGQPERESQARLGRSWKAASGTSARRGEAERSRARSLRRPFSPRSGSDSI